MQGLGYHYNKHQLLLSTKRYPFLEGLLEDLQLPANIHLGSCALSLSGQEFEALMRHWPDPTSLKTLREIYKAQGIFWKIKGQVLDLTVEPVIYSIINITPDSFHDGSENILLADVLTRIRQEISQGALIFELGGKSSHPQAPPLSQEEEWARIEPFIHGIQTAFPELLLAVDSNCLWVMERAVEAGVDILNDIDGFDTVAKRQLLAQSDIGAVVMHSNRQAAPKDSLKTDALAFFKERLQTLQASGVDLKRVCLDAGVGFSYQSNPQENMQRMGITRSLVNHQRPVMVAISRKKYLKTLFGYEDTNSEIPSTFLARLMIEDGARVIRTHDVASVQRMLAMTRAYQESRESHES